MTPFSPTRPEPSVRPLPTRSRFELAHPLQTDDLPQVFVRIDPLYEELNRFTFDGSGEAHASPAAWTGSVLRLIADRAKDLKATDRPLHVPVPDALLTDPNAVMACESAVRQTEICAQEVCLTVRDSALMAAGDSALHAIARLHARGFRIALDARQSWDTAFDEGLRCVIDTIRLAHGDYLELDIVADRVGMAKDVGITVALDRLRYRDEDTARAMGVTHALAFIADA